MTLGSTKHVQEYPTSPHDPQLHVTHSGLVLLNGSRAYKFKRDVNLGFLDFSTVEARRDALVRELRLNQRLAPDVYLGLGSLEAGTAAQPEPCLVMRRLPDDRRLTAVLTARPTDPDRSLAVLDAVARQVARFHASARRGADVDRDGRRDALRHRWRDNLASVESSTGTLLDHGVVQEVADLVDEYLTGREALFDDRIAGGHIVDGHGDLIAQDVFCLDDGPRILDCLDFDDRLRHVDVLDDVAFLAMDVERLDSPALAEHLWTRYLELTGDPAPPSLRHHYVAYRAFVRAKVGCLSGAAHDRHHGHLSSPEEHAVMALRHLRTARVRLVLCGGGPGTGKTTLSGALADRLGWVVVSSDRVRKELAGVDPESDASAPYGAGIYTPGWTERTYREMVRRAELLLQRGESVVLDATWSAAEHRLLASHAAARCSVPLVELECRLTDSEVADRIATRGVARTSGGTRTMSDADSAVADRVRATSDRWHSAHGVDTSRPVATTVDELVATFSWGSTVPARARPRPQMAPD
ncbi:bifunctional aminoglycoside phosphotransferase/ATP-binding protein [Nocardioides plantarum]|uniref:AAA family ATPase n=2 Tax=Nocardioides plantarum TaxID=29299 RepID=A0ABV5K7J6_9ACTN|nr:AAA family ATPase [Nocardioides plantarum]